MKRKPVVAWAVVLDGKFEVARKTKGQAKSYISYWLLATKSDSIRIVKLIEDRKGK
jgi:hypothetical protein